MNDYLLNNSRSVLIPGLLLAVLAALLLPYLWAAVLGAAALFFFYKYKKNFVIAIIIFAYLAVTGDRIETVRNVLNIIALAVLLFIFLNQYGLVFRNYKKVPGEIIYFIAFLFFTLFVSSIFSADPSAGFVSILRFAAFFLICYIFYSFIEGRETVLLYLYGIFLAVLGLFASIFISLYDSGFTLLKLQGSLIRFSGLYDNPNYVGLLLVVAVPMIVSLFFIKEFKTAYRRTVLSFFLVINVAVLLLADSRASLLAIAVAVTFMLLTLNRKLFFRLFISGIVVLIILLIFTDAGEFLGLFLRLNRLGNRDYFWATGIDIIKAHPVFGVGPDMFQKYFFTFMPSAVTRYYNLGLWAVGKPHPHNFFIFFTAENGILGFFTSVYFWILFFIFSFKAIKLSRKLNFGYYVISTAAAGIGMGIFARSFFEITGYLTYGFITRDLPFWIVFMFVIFIYQKMRNENVLVSSGVTE